MRAIQQEARHRVIEVPRLPGTGVVAGFALLAETSFMLVILLMTAVTSQRCILEGGRQVAFVALDLAVAAGQGETRQFVIEGRVLPFLFVMTRLALVAQLALVLVILLVTGNTGAFQLALVNVALLRQVAAIALAFPMLALEQVFGFLVVIENAALPILGRVAAAAFFAITPLVPLLVIILAVTGDALGFHLQGLGIGTADTAFMTSLAFGILVLVAQGKLGVVMIEVGILPTALVMAGLAFFAQFAAMAFFLIILLVAGDALRRQLDLINRAFFR